MQRQLLRVTGQEQESRTETAAEAFTRLDGRIALMTRAVEQMSAERATLEIPDYDPTLRKTNAHLADIDTRLEAIEGSPALDMTPEDMGARIAAAGQKARDADRATIEQARQDQASSIQALRQIIGNARTQRGQRQHLLWGIGGGILAGCLLWSFLPGVIARAMPDSWHWPERRAADMVGEPTLWDAGIRMMRAENPESWQFVAEAAEMRRRNREAIESCEKRAGKTMRPVRCAIKIEAGPTATVQ